MSLDYKIKFSDISKPSIVIKPKEQNNDTTLTLFGLDFEKWGSLYNENIVNLWDNWCNDYEPGYPGQVLEGQFWYDQLEDKLKICVSSDPLEWDVIANEESPLLTNYITSTNFNKIMDNYIPLLGNTIPAGPILVKMDTSDPLSLVTKKYVETLVCLCSKNKIDAMDDNPFIKQSGNNITTKLILIDDASDLKNGLTKQRVKSNVFMGYDIHTDKTKIFKKITDLIVAPNAIMASTVECGGDFLVTISGEFTMADGVGEGTFTMNEASDIFDRVFPIKNDVDSYYVLLQGAASNATSVANTGKMNEIYVSEISPPDIKIKRANTTGATKAYITIYWTVKPPNRMVQAVSSIPSPSPPPPPDVPLTLEEQIVAAGGSVTGELRVTMEWWNEDDLDLHVIEPGGEEIWFTHKVSASGGKLDIDNIHPTNPQTKHPIENIIWANADTVLEGEYAVHVVNYAKRGESSQGFNISVVCRDKTFPFNKTSNGANQENILIAKFNYSKTDGVTIT